MPSHRPLSVGRCELVFFYRVTGGYLKNTKSKLFFLCLINLFFLIILIITFIGKNVIMSSVDS